MTLMHRIIHLYPQARPPRQPSADHLHRPLLALTHGSAIIDAVAIRGRGQPQTADKAALEKKTADGLFSARHRERDQERRAPGSCLRDPESEAVVAGVSENGTKAESRKQQ